MNDSEKIENFRAEYIKLGCCLADIHSAYNAGDLKQLDYDVMYFGYCFAMAKIKRDVFNISPKAAMSF